ncbi:phage tail protein [Bacillus sp. DX4.1]|uniref:prophage endopeptidase tail family protein n=1 Tax=Bacillus sp. DX4.1 TaxID=3055867 RepID=UPI0025A231B1|nr:phage tail protein [Bacillus sp. DX4.1]MDM5189350.1 phage tail protein [Bacillus sp. DX4.1]
MKRVERPKIEQLGTGDQFHLIDMQQFEVIEGKNEPSSIRFVATDTEMNKRVYEYVEDRNLLIFEGQYYIILVNHQDELGFKDCDAIQIGAELSLQTQERKITGYFSIDEALSHAFAGSNFKFINRCSKHNQVQFDNFGGEGRMKMIRKVLDRFDIECIFDNMTVIFADRIGKKTDKLYKFGYNVNAIKKTTDDSNCSFSVLLLGHKPSEEEGGGPQFTYYYESPLKYKMPELIRYRQAENIDDDRVKDNATAEERCMAEVNDIPVVSITVDHKEASFDDSNEPKVGDRAILQHHKYNMDFDVRVVKRTRYPFEQTPNVYEFSNKRDELVDRTEEQKKWTSDILSIVKELDKKLLEESSNYTDRINAITDEKVEEAKQESEAAKKLAELVKENQKNFQTRIIESNTAPTDNLEADKSLWLDTSKGKPGILKKWNGKTWDIIVPDVDGAIKASEGKTNKEIQQIISDMESKVEGDWLNEQLKDKADKSGVYTREESDKKLEGFVSKQIYETNQNGNIEKFEDIGTKFTQTDEAIKQMATKQSVTDLGNNLTSVSEAANEAKQTAEGNTRTISDIKTTVDEQKTTVGNLSKKTTEIEEKAGQITEKLTSVEQKQIQFEQKTAELTRTTDSIKQSVESISKTQTTQGEQLEQAKSTLETQAKSIEGKVGIKQVEDYVGGISSINLIRNSTFTNGTKYWGIGSKFPAIVDKNTIHLGDFSLKLAVTGETAPAYNSFTSNRVSVTPGEDVVVSAYFYTKNIEEHDRGKIRMVPIFWKSDGTQLKAATNDFAIPNDTWVRQSHTLKAPTDAVTVGLRAYVLQNGTFWLAQPMLQKGTVASTFMENPNDMVDKDKILDDLAEKVATADYNKKVNEIDNRFTVNEEGIKLSAKTTEVYTRQQSDGKYATDSYVKTMEGRIEVTEKEIINTVRKGNVISTINQTAEEVKIAAKRINLVGAVTAESIAGKLLEGITIRAKDPADSSKFTEMSNGRIFTQGNVTPNQWNQGAAKFITGLEGGKFYSRGYKPDGKEANYVEMTASGASFSTGNDSATYGAQSFTLLDQGKGKTVTARAYDGDNAWWRPAITLLDPENNERAVLSPFGLKLTRFGQYENEWFTGDKVSRLSLYKAMLYCDEGWNGYLQIKSGSGSSHNGVVATEYKTTSQRKLKTYVKDLQFDALQDVLSLKIKEYYFKSDIANLYDMREQKEEGQPPYTLNDIPKYYGFMVDDCPIVFTDTERKGVNLYASLSVTIKGFQQYVQKTDGRLNQIEKVIIDENNSKRRSLRKSHGRTTTRCYTREKYLSCAHHRVRGRKSRVESRK